MRDGEVLGVVGANGAGKSTLLKILADVTLPSAGKWVINGSKLAILEVSSGFTPYLSGRENVFRRLALMGYAPEKIRALEPDIIDFSELEEVIDQPVRTYSTGMKARLAFATVTAPECDVLLLDELLSVGDEYFQGKCLRRIRDICGRGTTAIMVSHDLLMIERLCDRVIWIDHGTINADGSAFDTVMAYFGKNGDYYDKTLPREYGAIRHIETDEQDGVMTVTVTIERVKLTTSLYLQVVLHDAENGSLAVLVNNGLGLAAHALPEGLGDMKARVRFARPPGMRLGIVGVVLIRSNSIASHGIIEDAWGWDNNRLIKLDLKPMLCAGGYAERGLKWQRIDEQGR